MQNKIISYIKKHEILLFISITYICSWIIWGWLYSSYIGIINKSIYKEHFMLFVDLGSFIPSTISIVITRCLYKKKGLKELLIRLTKWKYSFMYYLFVIGCCPLIYYVTILIYEIVTNSSQIQFVKEPYSIFIATVWILVFSGPLGEEIGWRGFLLPRLQKKLSPIKASLVISFIWACWHLPLFYISGTSQYGTSFFLFLIGDIYYAIQITWVFNKTKGSLIFPILYHTAINVSFGLANGVMSNSFTYIYGIIELALTVPIIIDMIRNRSQKMININKYVL